MWSKNYDHDLETKQKGQTKLHHLKPQYQKSCQNPTPLSQRCVEQFSHWCFEQGNQNGDKTTLRTLIYEMNMKIKLSSPILIKSLTKTSSFFHLFSASICWILSCSRFLISSTYWPLFSSFRGSVPLSSYGRGSGASLP